MTPEQMKEEEERRRQAMLNSAGFQRMAAQQMRSPQGMPRGLQGMMPNSAQMSLPQRPPTSEPTTGTNPGFEPVPTYEPVPPTYQPVIPPYQLVDPTQPAPTPNPQPIDPNDPNYGDDAISPPIMMPPENWSDDGISPPVAGPAQPAPSPLSPQQLAAIKAAGIF